MLNWSELDGLYKQHNVVPIAYRGVLSLVKPDKIFVYYCITRKLHKSVNPYYIGTFSPDLSVVCVNSYERNYHLAGREWWQQEKPPEGTNARKQWMDWVWRDERERLRFNAWLDQKFGRIDGGEETEILSDPEPVQLTIF